MQKLHRSRIHLKIRKHLKGTTERPRLCVFRSNKSIYAQVVDDALGKTLVFASDKKETGTKKEKAYKVGQNLAQKALKAKITAVVFDRGGFLFEGRVAEVARGAREGGLKF